jgi:hypothetical protein
MVATREGGRHLRLNSGGPKGPMLLAKSRPARCWHSARRYSEKSVGAMPGRPQRSRGTLTRSAARDRANPAKSRVVWVPSD